MSSARIDCGEIREMIADAIGSHPCLLEAQLRGRFVTPVRDRAIVAALPMGPKMAQRVYDKMPRETRCEIDDLEQASRIGVILGIDRYNPHKMYKPKQGPPRPVRVDTYIFAWISKTISEEVADTYWRVSKPDRDDHRRYFADSMTHEERTIYARIVFGVDAETNWLEETDPDTVDWKERRAHVHAEAMA